MATKKKSTNTIDLMTLAELQTRRIQIAEQVITSGIHWELDESGVYQSVLVKTDYWNIVERINRI